VTPWGIKPVTFRVVAQCLRHRAARPSNSAAANEVAVEISLTHAAFPRGRRQFLKRRLSSSAASSISHLESIRHSGPFGCFFTTRFWALSHTPFAMNFRRAMSAFTNTKTLKINTKVHYNQFSISKTDIV
jgi:hypothetical protein